MRKSTAVGILSLPVFIWSFFVIGWVANLVFAIKSIVGTPTLAELTPFTIVQVIGIFTGPIGSFIGWYGIFA